MAFSFDDLLNIPTMGGYAVGKKALTGNWTGGGPDKIGLPGNNDMNAGNYADQPSYNPNDFNYGGTPGGADQAANIYGNWANGYVTEGGNDFRRGAGYLDANDASRGQQEEALGLMRQRALGQDLISRKIAAEQGNKLALAQQSLRSSARGPAALALAQQTGAAATSAGLSDIASSEEIAAANEQLANEQAWFGGATGVRTGDLSAAGAAGTLGSQQGQLGLGFSQLQNSVRQSQLEGSMGRQKTLAGAYGSQQETAAGISQQNSANSRFWADKALSGVQSAMPTPGQTGSDERMKQGIAPVGGSGPRFATEPSRADSEMTGLLAKGLEPFRYEYKPGFGKPGANVGPMAQNMMGNPITGVAVEQDPNTGLFTLDRDKLMKLTAGSVGHLASHLQQIEKKADAALAASHRGLLGRAA